MAKILGMGGLPQFSKELDRRIEGSCNHVVLNLKRLESMSGATMGYFIRVHARLRAAGGELVLSEPSRYFKEAVKTLGIDQVFASFPSDNEARKYIQRPPFQPGPIPKGVGYWGGGADDPKDLPTPQVLVRTLWQFGRRARIARYLANGNVLGGWCGTALCRLCDESFGACDMTDGVWIWPERLEHYVLEHAVSLPGTFLETMRSNAWQVPKVPDTAGMSRWLEEGVGHYGDLSARHPTFFQVRCCCISGHARRERQPCVDSSPPWWQVEIRLCRADRFVQQADDLAIASAIRR